MPPPRRTDRPAAVAAGAAALLALGLACAAPQAAEPGSGAAGNLESSLTALASPASGERFFTFALENDALGSGSDRNYTNGVRATWFAAGAEPGPIGGWLLDRLSGPADGDTPALRYYSIGQNLYTPDDITEARPDPGDRPYAALLYGSVTHERVRGNRIDGLELMIGLVGPMALGEPVQKTVHRLIGARQPRGWDAQLENEPGFNVIWERRWPTLFTVDVSRLRTRVIPHVGASLGTINTHASAGLTLQLVPERYRWQSTPLRVRPAIPGSGVFFPQDASGVGWSLFLGAETRLVGRNLFLDGNTFRDSPSVDRRAWVQDVALGVSLAFRRTRVDYTLNWRSREFEGQEEPQLFGAISIGRRF